MKGEPIWVSVELAEAIHVRQLAEHGGLAGLRDGRLLDSALARPRQRWAYGDADTDMPSLAASYAYGIARNHPFIDGNKRVAYTICRTFLVLNGWDMVGTLEERYPVFVGLAAGEVSEDGLTAWLREHARPDRVSETRADYG